MKFLGILSISSIKPDYRGFQTNKPTSRGWTNQRYNTFGHYIHIGAVSLNKT